MKKRVFIYTQKGGKPVYATPVLTGDREEFFQETGSPDGCDVSLFELTDIFHACNTMTEFIKASVEAQSKFKQYQESGIQVCTRISRPADLPPADEYIVIRQGRNRGGKAVNAERLLRLLEVLAEAEAIGQELWQQDNAYDPGVINYMNPVIYTDCQVRDDVLYSKDGLKLGTFCNASPIPYFYNQKQGPGDDDVSGDIYFNPWGDNKTFVGFAVY